MGNNVVDVERLVFLIVLVVLGFELGRLILFLFASP